MLNKLKTWLVKHDWQIICLLLCAGYICLYYLLTHPSAGGYNAATEAVQTQTKEVKTHAGTVRQTQSANDRKIQQAVKEAARNIPADLDALIGLANEIIRGSNGSRQ